MQYRWLVNSPSRWSSVRLLSSLFVVPYLAVAAMDSAAEPLSFPQALERVRSRNEQVMAAQEDVNQRLAERAAARGIRYPNVELDFEHIFINDVISIKIDPIPWGLWMQDSRFTHANVTATLPLYAGGLIGVAEDAADARVAEARAQGRTSDDELLTQLAERYFGLCLAQRARDVYALKVDVMERHAYRAQRLMEEGIIARIEYLNAQVAVADAEREHQSAARNVSIAHEGVRNITVSDEPLEPSTALFLIGDLESCEEFQAYVDQGHPILDMIAAKSDLAHQGVRAQEAEDKPTIYAFGMHELIEDQLTALDPTWAAGLGMKWTLFDGFQTRNKVKAAEAVERKVGYMRQKIQRDLKTLVLKRYEEMEQARDAYRALDATLALTRENLRVRNRAFEEGLATSVEVVDAALSHARAQLGRVKAAYDFDVAFFHLLEACGRGDRCAEYLERAVPIAEHPPEALFSQAEGSPTLETVKPE